MTIASKPGASGPAETGIPNFPVTTVGASGLQFIDGLIAGKKWDSPPSTTAIPTASPTTSRTIPQIRSRIPPAERPADGGGAPGARQHAPHRQVRISRILGRGLHQPRRQLLRRGHRLHHPAVRQQHRRRHRLRLLSRHPCRRRRRLVRRLGRQPGAGQLRQLHRHPRDRPRARAEARPRDLGLRGAAVRHRLDGILGDDLPAPTSGPTRSTSTTSTGATPRPS